MRVALGAIALAACSSNALPGTSLGTFTVTAHLVTNTCDLPYSDRTFDVSTASS